MLKQTRRLCFFALLLTLLCTLSSAGAASKIYGITASFQLDGTEIALKARVVENRYMLFLPGPCDPSAVTITLDGVESLTAGDLTLTSGETADFSAIIGDSQKLLSPKGKKIGALTVYHGSALPCMFLSVDAKQLKKVDKSKNNEITEGGVIYVEPDGSVSYNGDLTSLHGRGNSTFAYKKKPYQLKLSKKVSLSGMNKSKTWILLANYVDLSLLRNKITLDLCREIGIPYAVDSRMVDVYINGLYNGLYLMTEKIQVGKQRVDITDLEEITRELNDKALDSYPTFDEKTKELPIFRGYEIPVDPEDVTGGYILEMEKSYRFRENIDNGFKTDKGLNITIKEPTCASRAQVHYIGSLFNDFHEAVWAKDGISPVTGTYYADYIDLPSFARKFLVEEFSKNYDAQASSQFFFKDSDAVDGRIYAGPCWDYDLSYGNIRNGSFYNGSLPTGVYVTASSSKANLYWLLSRHDDFMAEVAAAYHADFAPAIRILLGEAEPSGDSQLQSIDAYVAAMDASARMNFVRWPAAIIKGYYNGSGKNFDASVKYLRNFITKRLAFLDTQWPEE